MIDPTLLDEIEDLRASERGAEAAAKLEALGDLAEDRSPEATRARYLRLRVANDKGGALDRMLIDLRGLLTSATGAPGAPAIEPGLRARILADLVRGFALKRCEGLARKTLAELAALETCPSLTAEAFGDVDIAFDRRTEALDHYQRAVLGDEPRRGHVGLSTAHYLLGHFEESVDHARHAESHPRSKVAALRRQAIVARVHGSWAEHALLVEAILAATPGGDRQRDDRLDRASSHYAGGRRDEALEELRQLWRENEKDRAGWFSRSVLDNVERVPQVHVRTQLPSFPTVRQKRNFCGPASLELMLRSLGFDASQDVIAAAVKEGEGTSTWAMTQYLERLELETIRFEATTERLRTCLEAGLPVIVEEEYSTTFHVAVVVGLDENLGLLYIQDPMSHVTREEPIRSETQLGSLFRNAALVALRKDDREKKARLTAAGVVDAEHVRLVDAVEDPALRKEPKKRLEMLEKAIGLCEDYPLAWSKRVRTLWASGANRDQMLAAIRKARVRYAHLEFSHQVHAQFLFEEDRYEEAIIELDAAQRLDRWDANNFQREAECHQYLGRMKEAVDVYWKALGLDPSHVRATENLASLALEAKERALAEHLSSCALDMAPKNPFNHLTSAKLVEIRTDHAEDDWREVARRARAGFELDPEHPSLRMKLASALAELPDEASRNEAIEIFQATIKKYPKWLDALKATATALERAERIDEAITLIVEAIEVVTVPPIELVKLLLPLLGDRGRDDEVLRWTGRAIERFPASAELKVIELDWLYDHDRYDPGFARTKEVAAKAPKDFFYQLKVAKWLGDQPATRSQAVEIFRASLEATPSFPWRRGRLMKLLALEPEEAIAVAKAEPKPSRALLAQQASLEMDVGRFDDAVATLRRARELGGSPDSEEYDHWIRAMLAQGTVEEALARLADSPADVFTWRSRAVLLSELGRHDEALDLLRPQPDDDSTARETLRRLTRKDEHYRDELERRTRLLLDSPKITRSSRAYWRGVLAGSRASRGERDEWERILATEPSSERVDYLDRALVAPRHRALMAEVNHAIATRFPRDQAIGYHAHDASTRGDREGAVRIYREALERCPTTRYFIPCLGEELLLLGRDDEVEALHDDLRRGGSSGFGVLAIARLLRGERQSAIELATRADRLRLSWGAAADDHVMTQAALATLRGDTARIEALRTTPSQHFDPESPLWSRLTKLATETT